MTTKELRTTLAGLDDRATYARGVADGRVLKKQGASPEELSVAAHAALESKMYACGLVDGYFEFRPPEEFLAGADWYRAFSFPRDAKGTRGNVMPLGSFGYYKYVVTLSFLGTDILLSRRRDRTTWETQGGHIEPGETPMEAARRELYEESGAVEYDIEPLCDYFGYDDVSSSAGVVAGMVFLAHILKLGPMPESEMAEVRAFSELPKNLTYPGITPALFEQVKVKDHT